ncbi:unnamed protein product [Linum trigynum]|uniref:Uncharacterized protein n=1 Tax=Linum trigynum TaxID=586398 RepID=A0AAV2E289_9ROSI
MRRISSRPVSSGTPMSISRSNLPKGEMRLVPYVVRIGAADDADYREVAGGRHRRPAMALMTSSPPTVNATTSCLRRRLRVLAEEGVDERRGLG